MTVLGIVGSEEVKFTPETESKARQAIISLIVRWAPLPLDLVVSGACHLGGIDRWAIEEAKKLDADTREFPPKELNWEKGYRPRNIQIAKISDLVVCITLKKLPETYTGMRFDGCYHCKSYDHVKSGGCWTVKYAQRLGKRGQWIIIE